MKVIFCGCTEEQGQRAIDTFLCYDSVRSPFSNGDDPGPIMSSGRVIEFVAFLAENSTYYIGIRAQPSMSVFVVMTEAVVTDYDTHKTPWRLVKPLIDGNPKW